jgi:hypothetical protein
MPLRHKDTKPHQDFLVLLRAFVTLWQDYEFLFNSKKENSRFISKVFRSILWQESFPK